MKKLLIILTMGLLASCSKLFDLQPIDKLNPEDAFRTEQDLRLYTNSFYLVLPSAEEIIREDVMSDYLAGRNVNPFLLDGAFNANQSSGWNWGNLRNINFFLEHVGRAEVSDAVKNHYRGIARFFRAWFYFDKVKRFGDVPWYGHTLNTDDPDLYKPRDPRQLVMDSVLADLNFAVQHISNQKDPSATQVTSWVAQAFKSRVCLFEGTLRKYRTDLELSDADHWLDEAVNAAQAVMDGGAYILYTNAGEQASYRQLFVSDRPVSDEVILSWVGDRSLRIFHDANWAYTSASYGSRVSFTKTFINTYLKLDGTRFTDEEDYGTQLLTQELAGRDRRLAQTIRMPSYTREGTPAPPDFTYTYTGYQPLKFTVEARSADGRAENINAIPIIRYAEVLLNYAEARAERGVFNTNDWEMTVAALRRRAGITNVSYPQTIDPYLQTNYFPGLNDAVLLEIRRERAIELALEGFRYPDLIRWNRGKLLEMPYEGMYVPALDIPVDISGDGRPDVAFVNEVPRETQPGIQYYVIDGTQSRLTEGDRGRLLWLNNIRRVWENYKFVYPIPYNELVRNPNLEQNEGWN
ncbi:RagB/SusD family nutrient uptake outer membrane protein [Parapedobacter sp. ISTM3]|uniref:Starch-binding associating with outer membrane n=1 Tax=Parapedobacter luteus TaxID=623280 RepID=A0A1T5DDY8_9SPHI|nr:MULTISPECIES: RagB/SusD family nutrient uptake outer membrane protein [Parapedobacter]MBK1438397.1 RagB/SusD family nutrient uptake outer membrane protein [Parapedobacter sp. ISTM3]SKB69929.1 Starch-binding associating with outer membrane [Parapedobacter luteus]